MAHRPEPGRITSRQNPSVRLLRSLTDPRVRRESGLFLLEGRHLLEEAVRRSYPLDLVAWSPRFVARENGEGLLSALQARGVRLVELTDDLMDYASAAEAAPGVLAAAQQPVHAALPPDASLLVLVDGLSDAGNLGTIIRTAAAAGADAVLLAGATVDPLNPKCVRASAGAILWQPVLRVAAPEGWDIVAAAPGRGLPYDEGSLDAIWRDRVILAVGSEAHGLSASLQGRVTHWVHVPMRAGVESLNAAVACGILMYHASRLRNAV